MSESGERNYDKYLTWLRQEFLPLQLATPVTTLKQIVENAIRYWNTHSAYRVETMADYSPGTKRVQLNAQFKAVADCYPSKTTTWIWNDHPFKRLIKRLCQVIGIENSVKCGKIRESQATSRLAVKMLECGQSAAKPPYVWGRFNEHNRNIL